MTSTDLLARTDTVALGPLRRDLLDTYLRWDNDPAVMRGYGRPGPITRDERAAGLDAQLAGTNMHFTLYALAADHAPTPVGTATLAVDDTVQAAEFFVCLGAEGRGRGLAAPLTRLVLQQGFAGGLRNVVLTVLAPNTAAIRAYERAGFRRVGHRRDSGLWEGRRCDELIMDAVPGDLDPTR